MQLPKQPNARKFKVRYKAVTHNAHELPQRGAHINDPLSQHLSAII